MYLNLPLILYKWTIYMRRERGENKLVFIQIKIALSNYKTDVLIKISAFDCGDQINIR